MAIAYLGLGSNLGDRVQHLMRAYATLAQHPAISVQAVSSLYHTAPVGVTEQNWFLNAVAQLYTTLSPRALLTVTQATERRLGRTPMFHWGPRVVDVDILLYDSLQLHTPFLTIPHAALRDRLFVLIPLHELAPDLRLPCGPPIRDLLTALADHDRVQQVGTFPAFNHGASV
ncbi:MAG: 2-amino-4-hydroxy-6-hydroxymethyldihydropteridine diphosphokinase [Candidatus Tectomicrobia bacterium]|nr:2-amino-4-hydroxy-6-hydroxymethyldihydropteridine diphosphokinase [Candidatus Tectomicrobia bacterium]